MSTIYEDTWKSFRSFLEVAYDGAILDKETALVLTYKPTEERFKGSWFSCEPQIPEWARKDDKFLYMLENLSGVGETPEEALKSFQSVVIMRLEEHANKLQNLLNSLNKETKKDE